MKVRKFVILLIANFTINCLSSFTIIFDCLVQTWKTCEDSQKESSGPQFRSSTTDGATVLACNLYV